MHELVPQHILLVNTLFCCSKVRDCCPLNRRNFVMNKQQGLVIRPYKRAHTNRHTDQELLHLTTYLTHIGRLESLSTLNHRKWERYLEKYARG